MEMYIRIVKKDDALKFKYKDDSNKKRAMQYNMVDWRVEVENGIIKDVIAKIDLYDINQKSYYEREYEKILKRFNGNNNKVYDLLSSI